eukprot:6209243-Pleurochrysis_carterae.AAC.3
MQTNTAALGRKHHTASVGGCFAAAAAATAAAAAAAATHLLPRSLFVADALSVYVARGHSRGREGAAGAAVRTHQVQITGLGRFEAAAATSQAPCV